MKRSILLTFISLIFTGQCIHAAYEISVFVRNLPVQTVKLAASFGEKKSVVDSLKSTPDGKLTFRVTDDHAIGMYSLIFRQNAAIDILFNRENIAVYTVWPSINDSLVIIRSVENMVYYDFIQRTVEFQKKQSLLFPVIDYYPREEPFYGLAIQEFSNNKLSYRRYYDSLLAQYPYSYVARIIRLKRPVDYPEGLDENKRFEYLRDHYFEGITLDDPELLRSDIYTRIIIDYMSLYGNPNFTQEQLEEAMVTCVGKIIDNTKANKQVHDFIVEYLVKGFEKYHFDRVLEYLSERLSSEEQCENTGDQSTLGKRLEQYARLAAGKPAPPVVFLDEKGNQVKLDQVSSEYTLILFWASWCPHCVEMLPEVKKIYDSQPRTKLQILSFSLDTSRTEYGNYIKTHKINWITHCEFKGWQGKIVSDYNVYATPTMFLLDRNKVILAKPISLTGLKQDLAGFGISAR